MPTRGVVWVARLVWAVGAVLAGVCALAGVLFGEVIARFMGDDVGPAMLATVGIVGFGYASAGLLILRHRPRHPVGWLLILAGPILSGEFVALIVGSELAYRGNGFGAWLLLLSSLGFWPTVMVAGPLTALFFPDGRLPSRRWRRPVAVAAVMLGVGLLLLGVRPGPVSIDLGPFTPDNPLGADVLPPVLFDVGDATGAIAIPLSLLAAVSAVVVRFRRAEPDERRQLKWFTAASLLWGVLVVASLLLPLPAEFALVVFGALLLLPISILVAITRYRLYEIDTLINRALVYIPLVATVAGLYAASVALFQRLFVAFTGDTSDAAAVISALVLAAVFTPIRKWLESLVDRRFKPAPPSGRAAAPAPADGLLGDPAFVAAVEAVARRVALEERRSRRA